MGRATISRFGPQYPVMPFFVSYGRKRAASSAAIYQTAPSRHFKRIVDVTPGQFRSSARIT
jgi:hypothetical protein